MKPLDLQIFPKHPDADAYYVNGSYTPWAIVGQDKRLTDAELAAQGWQAVAVGHLSARDGDIATVDRAVREAEVWERFAIHPNHDAPDDTQ